MSNENTCRVQETAACCCVDVGTILDNTDCTAKVEQQFANRADAEAFLEQLTEKARDIESDACEITSTLTDNANGVQLHAEFTFSCQAETMIFQLALR
ncbi:MAG: YfcZ/YiiS family protein [Plesiomonas sp.]|uniref:YfcZ/YiiS family protein n=1 Tax=Plesiomonas sp. TaxID=2486279 RepID=UPI003F31A80B